MDRIDRCRSPRTVKLAAALALAVLLAPLIPDRPASAEIYQWKDAQGRLHFAQDLNQVPPAERAAARAGARREGEGREIQRFEPAPPAAVREGRRTHGARFVEDGAGGRVHRIRVQRTGQTMRVHVRLNDEVVAPFILDTGASDVSIPHRVAVELGLDLGKARTHLYRTANGIVENPVVRLSSVELGDARVENVPASVSRTMEIGLLGLSFFNHCRYDVDPVAGVVTLRPNGLVESGRLRGGRSASQWRGEFSILQARRQAIRKAIAEDDSGRVRREARREAALEEIDRQLRVLADEADDARVPMTWRD